jgi:hypothetical protein
MKKIKEIAKALQPLGHSQEFYRARMSAWKEFNKETGIDWEKFKRLLTSELADLENEKP